jgi:hypothetical protein
LLLLAALHNAVFGFLRTSFQAFDRPEPAGVFQTFLDLDSGTYAKRTHLAKYTEESVDTTGRRNGKKPVTDT